MRNESMNLSKNEMMMVMHDQEQEIEKLKSQVAELQAKLDGYEIKVSESGNLAEAAAKVSGLFEAAQRTVDTYLENMKKRDERAEAAFDDVQKQAEQIISEAEDVASKRLAAADAEIEEKWAVIESRLLVMYESHKGLKELVESGIFTIPGKE
jgi:cell division septum initiation protein DivIVA